MHPGRILGIVMGLVILASVFVLPIFASQDTLYGVVGPLLGAFGDIQYLPYELMVFDYLLVISFILLVIAGAVGFFPLATGVLGIVAMAMLSIAPSLLSLDVSWSVAFYVLWITSIIALGASFWHRRATQAPSQVVNVNVQQPPPTTPPPPPPPATQPSAQRSTIIVSPTISVKTGTTEEKSPAPASTQAEKVTDEKSPASTPTEVEKELGTPASYTPEEAMEMFMMLKERAESQPDEKAKEAMSKLQFKDVSGKAWKIDSQTNNWVFYDGKKWKKATPPPVLETK